MSRGFFYLSMVDESREKGDQFVGATIVYAPDAAGALEEAKNMGLIPTGVQVAMVELYTQDEANERITDIEMLQKDVVDMLWARFATKAEIEASGAKPLPHDQVDAFVCKDHANPLGSRARMCALM